MEKFEKLAAIAIPLGMDNIDTDQIFPSRFQSKNRADGLFGTYLLHDHRYDENGERKKDFIFNDERLQGAKILVAAGNYACGSARPGAIFAHIDYGFKVLIAESFGPVFASVAYKAGLLTIQLESQYVRHLRKLLLDSPGSSVTVDLQDEIVIAPDGSRYNFEIDPFVKTILIEGLSEIDLTLKFEARIRAFEAQLIAELPWMNDGPCPMGVPG